MAGSAPGLILVIFILISDLGLGWEAGLGPRLWSSNYDYGAGSIVGS
ncbi:MAG: hypothetical protein ACRDQ4_07740 [Pseudonocardiaceae bacterium]